MKFLAIKCVLTQEKLNLFTKTSASAAAAGAKMKNDKNAAGKFASQYSETSCLNEIRFCLLFAATK